jgi:hypothetical protein
MSQTSKDFFDREDGLGESDIVLIRAYRKQGVTVDWLAYSPEFEAIYADMQASGDTRDRGSIYRRLLNLRKSGRLPPVQLGLTG